VVYLLEPTRREWVQSAGLLGGLLKKQVKGIALQQSDIPPEKAMDGRFELPDICQAGDGFMFVSDRGRAALEDVAPSCIAFFPLKIKVPARMRPAAAYFFPDVLLRAQLIDWDRSPTAPRIVRAPDGRESRALKATLTDPLIKSRQCRRIHHRSGARLIWIGRMCNFSKAKKTSSYEMTSGKR
jgi:hypothetical protein